MNSSFLGCVENAIITVGTIKGKQIIYTFNLPPQGGNFYLLYYILV